MKLQCDMNHDCDSLVTHIGEKGWIYCAIHGRDRAQCGVERCRAIRVWERKLLEQGKPLPSYTPIRKPAGVPA